MSDNLKLPPPRTPHDRVVQDELEAVAEIQWQLSRRVTIKLNSGFGLTSKAPDFAPEIGVLFSF